MGGPYGAFTPEAEAALRLSVLQTNNLVLRNIYYADYANGNDGNVGTTRALAVKTLAQAYALCDAGLNDAVVVVPNGAGSGFQRISSTFTWSKASTHLIGAGNGVSSSPRASIRPTSGATAFTPLITWSANGCLITNMGFWSGFSTGTTSQICINLTGNYNRFQDCHIVGMADATSAGNAGSRSLKIGSGGSGENEFVRCTIGIDTVTRGAANASIEFAGATPRNKFVDCVLRELGSDGTPLFIIGTGAGCMDRDQLFQNCAFIAQIKSTGTAMTALASLPASAGGMLVFQYCTTVGVTDFGDATTEGQCYVDGAAPTAASSQVAVNPT